MPEEAGEGPPSTKASAKPKPAKPLKDEPGAKAAARPRLKRKPAAKKAPAKKAAKKA